MQTESAAYLVGRQKRLLSAKGSDESDVLFAAERVDEQSIEKRSYTHCTFANISFLGAEVKNCVFEDCVFIGCYFRKALLKSVEFKGCRFIGCDFPKTRVDSSRFGYCQFYRCVIEYDELKHSLPQEPNIRRDLAANLALAAESLGRSREARRYRLEAIDAHGKHLWAGVKHQSGWYREHFPGVRRFTAFAEVVGSRLNGLIWGHGERWGTLVVNFAILTFVVFPLLLLYAAGGIVVEGSTVISPSDAVWISVGTILPTVGSMEVAATTGLARGVLALEAFSGLVIGGLLVTLVFRTIIRR